MRPAPLLLALAALTLQACSCGAPAGNNTAPVVRITAPADGSVLAGAGPHSLVGTVVDAEETLTGTSVVWSSDRDGVLGFGALTSATLTAGQHRLTLAALDAGGLTGSAQVTVTVTGTTTTDTAPVATIVAPAPNAFFDQGQPIALEGRATDAEDGSLSGQALQWSSSLAGALGAGGQLTFSGAALGTHRLVLTATDSSGRSGYASIDLTVVPPGTNRPPVVTIAAPLDGATLTVGASVTLSGSASDPEDGALTGTALAWSSSRDGALGTGLMVSTSTLSQGVHVLTLTATDSLGLAASAAITVSVNAANNQPPTATISAPAAGHTVFQGTAVVFTGAAVDPEDGALTGTALAWSSSRDGALGTGSPLTASALSAGDHSVTLVATDSGGNTGTASVLVRVLPMNAAPTVIVTAPADNSSFSAGTNISFQGTANDAEDGALTGAALVWRSSRDGVLGTGSPLSSAGLSTGAHQVTLTATDSGGRSTSASIALSITPSTVNTPPVARLTGPGQGDTGQALTFDGSTSSDADGTLVSFRFDFGDGTPAVTGTAQSLGHTYAAAGTFTVTLTVTDNNAATASATLQVVIAQAARVPVVVDSEPEANGSVCQLARSGSTLHLAWYSGRHPTVWYGTYAGGVLTKEVVDALGFNVGGQAQPSISLQVDASGTPHLAYLLGGNVYYARKQSGNWQRERVDTTQPANDTELSLALNPTASEQPTVAWHYASPTYTRTAIAVRTGPNTWTTASPLFTSHTTVYDQRLLGEVAFDGTGRLLLPMYLYGNSSTGVTGYYLASWTPTATAQRQLNQAGIPALSSNASLTMGQGNTLYLLSGTGLLDITVAPTLSASTVRHSYVEVSSTGMHAVAVDAAGAPRLVVNHGSTLESVWADSQSFWAREDLGATDTSVIDAAVDGAGDTRACFFRAQKLMLY